MSHFLTPEELNFEHAAKVKKAIDGIGQLEVVDGVATRKIYVIWSEEHKSILHDPMTNLPVHSLNENHLREAAKVFKGKIITAHEALKKLLIQQQAN